MAETKDSPVDVYYDMEIAEICQHFSKSRNTVDKAVAKLVKDYPDAGYKYKNPQTRRITIKAEGVEKLSHYFRKKKNEISTVEVELRYENEKLKAIIEEKEKSEKQIEELYKQRLAAELERSRQTFLLENKTKDEKIKQLTEESQEKDDEIQKLKEEVVSIHEKHDSLVETKAELEKNNQELKENKEELEKNNQSLLVNKQELESENQKLKQATSNLDEVKQQLEEAQKKQEEYNSKGLFYRLFHKI